MVSPSAAQGMGGAASYPLFAACPASPGPAPTPVAPIGMCVCVELANQERMLSISHASSTEVWIQQECLTGKGGLLKTQLPPRPALEVLLGSTGKTGPILMF